MDSILTTIKDNNLVKRGEVIGVAVSGGSDSMALLHKMHEIADELDIEVVAIHIDHSIRENSASDAMFVMDYCKSNRIRAYKFKVDAPKIAKTKGISLESAAREARFGVFDALIKKGVVDRIAIAHHLQDQAETILLHLLRGTGLSGIKGMEIERDEVFIRPMLNTDKQSIMQYINYFEIPFVEDETNKESVYARNFIRNKIFPLINEKWPNAVNSLINFSKCAGEDDDYINSQLYLDAMQVMDKMVKIPTSYFLYHSALVSRMLFKAFASIGITVDIERKHIELIKDLARKGSNGSKLDLPMNVNVFKEYDYITITNKQKTEVKFNESSRCGEIEVPTFGKLIIKRVKDINSDKNALYFDYRKLPKDAVWRFRQDGDVFEKFGGGTKKLKSYLIDKKIPLRERSNIPVLASENEVFVIAGLEISEKVKVENVPTAFMVKTIKNQ